MDATGDAVVVRGLVKRFGTTEALAGLDMTVRAGEVHGFLGPNGAGKSTTLRALLGLIRVDAGQARVLGMDPWRDPVELHRRLAYVPGEVTLWPQLTGGETVDLLLRLRGHDPARTGRDELAASFRLDLRKRSRAYSRGNRQKVLLVAALAAPVDLLLLDEPTAGLDPLMHEVFVAAVTERAAQGTTVLLSSHVLSEVEELADAVTLIRDGRRVEAGTLADLRHLRSTRVRAVVAGTVPELHRVPGVRDLVVDGAVVSCRVDAGALTPVLAALAAAEVHEVTCEPPSLEQMFLDAYRTEPQGAGR